MQTHTALHQYVFVFTLLEIPHQPCLMGNNSVIKVEIAMGSI